MARLIKFLIFFSFIILSSFLDNTEALVALAFIVTFSLILDMVEDIIQTNVVVELKNLAINYKICLNLEKELYKLLLNFHSEGLKQLHSFLIFSIPFLISKFLIQSQKLLSASSMNMLFLNTLYNSNTKQSLKLLSHFYNTVLNTALLSSEPSSYQQIRRLRLNVLDDLRG